MPTATSTKIINPWPSASTEQRVISNLDKDVFNYFFRHIFAGDRGPRMALINSFFDKFYRACLAEGITASWDLGSNYDRVKAVLDRMNFDEKVEAPVPKVAKKKPIPARAA